MSVPLSTFNEQNGLDSKFLDMLVPPGLVNNNKQLFCNQISSVTACKQQVMAS